MCCGKGRAKEEGLEIEGDYMMVAMTWNSSTACYVREHIAAGKSRGIIPLD